ncbi:uncharacterized protein FA14DRAFT_181926 [Meira miltonrushii]|uniref:FCP1 homology domain-containing protein n=1 Tax=Meira miltonrushii TaxID=1280837 RepID=A0A316V371_9BASI|nr:uncharacterized protein FA14DRAFT_181926 [Meira miltonrushii]PWN32007.1 hypothetical protein FA14DRAFT_181926 [Meira miltonrushii]
MPRHRKTSRPVNEENQQQHQYNPPPSNYWQPHQYDGRSQYAQGQHYYQQYQQPYPVPNGWNAEQNYASNYGTNWQNDWYGTHYSAQNSVGHANVGPSHYNNSSWGGEYREEPQINGWNGGYYSLDYYPSSYQPKRYEGNRHIHTPVSGRSSRYPSPGKEGKRSYRDQNDEMRYDQSSESRWASRDRFQDPASNPVINEPRKHYLQQSLQEPGHYPINSQTPKPLPLLVLDLNGTLVYRSSRSSGTAAERSKFPTLRPYLACFLQYCLAVDAEHQPDPNVSQDAWRKWQEDRTKDNEEETVEDSEINGDKDARMSDSENVSHPKTHGTHFWPKENSEPEPLPSATYRLLLWSSAQPQNVDHMARAILNPNQAEQLLRVYARDTLVTRKFYSLKSPSVKDLEILWAALNNLMGNDEAKKRGEERLFAEARDREDRQVQQDQAALEKLHGLWNKEIVLPKENEKTGVYSDGFGYGPHNTLLLDDSVSKARIQPFNHLLVPEFDAERAKVVKEYKKKQAGESEKEEEEEEETDQDEEVQTPEDILLQIIGVLEHARYQKNVSSWIRFGGLGDLGNVSDEHPYREALRKCAEGDVEEDEKKAFKEWEAYFSLDLAQTEEDQGPRLQVSVGDRTPTFWAEEGQRALSRKGIEAVI